MESAKRGMVGVDLLRDRAAVADGTWPTRERPGADAIRAGALVMTERLFWILLAAGFALAAQLL